MPGEVLEIANRLLPHIAPDVPPATSVRAGADALTFARRGASPRSSPLLAVQGSIGVIVADAPAPAVLAELAAWGAELLRRPTTRG